MPNDSLERTPQLMPAPTTDRITGVKCDFGDGGSCFSSRVFFSNHSPIQNLLFYTVEAMYKYIVYSINNYLLSLLRYSYLERE